MKKLSIALLLSIAVPMAGWAQKIDRKALLKRNNPIVTKIDKLESLTVGNGDFAYTVDPTGMQTFPEIYSKGVSLGTMSSWGWHYNSNDENYKFSEVLEEHDLGHGHKELYAGQPSNSKLVTAGGGESYYVGDAKGNATERRKNAVDYFRSNPHRLHLGIVGLHNVESSQITDIHQELLLEQGEIVSNYKFKGKPVEVHTVCDPNSSKVAIRIKSEIILPIAIRMPYPTSVHSDDACDWTKGAEYHRTFVQSFSSTSIQMTHEFPTVKTATEFDKDSTANASYHFGIASSAEISMKRVDANTIVITPAATNVEYILDWAQDTGATTDFSPYDNVSAASTVYWHNYWYNGAMVDFSNCKDERAKELERRVILSQYLLAVNSGGETPPQETGLTYNSWFGKFHLEMIWWHQAQFALWGHPEKLRRTLSWYNDPQVKAIAYAIAKRQGFKGLRWMKMTDKTGLEAPSKVGSFLIWQQPHVIHLAELLRRCYAKQGGNGEKDIVSEFGPIVDETAKFMADFTTYDEENKRYVLRGYIPAQETLKAKEVVNSPYELSQWHLTMQIAQNWRSKQGMRPEHKWNDIVKRLSPLASDDEGKYLAAETATQTYTDIRFTQDHMAVLGALGIYPEWNGIDKKKMLNTLLWVQDNWHWDRTWGWDHPMTAMCAVRLGKPELALKSILADHRTNTYLVSGHNYQDDRLRIYLPGNGALLQCVALMCAGWDGCKEKNPGFPKDGNWDVRWEGIMPLP